MRATTGTLALTVLLLAGCGSLKAPIAGVRAMNGPDAKRTVRPSADIFPTEVGHTWRYAVVAHPQDEPDRDYPGSQTMTVEAASRTAKGFTITLRDQDSFSDHMRFPEIRFDGSTLTIAGMTYFGAASSRADDLTIGFLTLPLELGRKWDDGQWCGKVLARETVTVPAGTFDAWKLEGIGTYEQEYTSVGDYWFAPGVGIVKSALTIPGYYLDAALVPANAKLPAGPKLDQRNAPPIRR